MLVEIDFVLDSNNKLFDVVGPVNSMVIDLYQENISRVDLAKNDAYDFEQIDFDAPTEEFGNQIQLILKLDSHMFCISTLSQEHSFVRNQGRLNFRGTIHIVGAGQIKIGREVGALQDPCRNMSVGREAIFYFSFKGLVGGK